MSDEDYYFKHENMFSKLIKEQQKALAWRLISRLLALCCIIIIVTLMCIHVSVGMSVLFTSIIALWVIVIYCMYINNVLKEFLGYSLTGLIIGIIIGYFL